MEPRRLLIAAFCVLSVTPAIADEAQDDLKELVGRWRLVALSHDGQDVPPGELPPTTWRVRTDGSVSGKTPEGEFVANLVLDVSRDPKLIDIAHTSGEWEGKTEYGVYQLDGDKLAVNMTYPGADALERPSDFTTGSVYTFERVTQ